MRMTLLMGLALLTGRLAAAGPPSSPIEPGGKLTLTLPRQPAADEMLVVELNVGVLGPGTKIVIRSIDQEIAGTIAPYGIRAGQKAGVFTIPVPSKAVVDKKVSLLLEVVEKDASAARAPTRTEIEEAKLAFIRVSKRGEKGKP